MQSIDELISRDAQSWRAALQRSDADLELKISEASSNVDGTKRRIVAAAAAACVAALAVGIVAIQRGPVSDNNEPAGGISSTTPTTLPGTPNTATYVPPPTLKIDRAPVPIVNVQNVNGPISMPWQLISVDDATESVEVRYVTGDPGNCVSAVGFYVQETDKQVSLEAVSQGRKQHGACDSATSIATGRVQLSAPLGSRVLLHVPVDRDWVNTLP